MTRKVDILLAEDSVDDANLIRRALKPFVKEEIVWLRDGVEVIPYFRDKNNPLPKVIFLDLKMPKIGGIEVLKEIKSRPETRSIPIVVVTSSHENQDLETCYKLGANSYVVKPIDFTELTNMTEGLGRYWLELNEAPV